MGSSEVTGEESTQSAPGATSSSSATDDQTHHDVTTGSATESSAAVSSEVTGEESTQSAPGATSSLPASDDDATLEGQFICPSGIILSNSQLCDGTYDCPQTEIYAGGEDEDNCDEGCGDGSPESEELEVTTEAGTASSAGVSSEITVKDSPSSAQGAISSASSADDVAITESATAFSAGVSSEITGGDSISSAPGATSSVAGDDEDLLLSQEQAATASSAGVSSQIRVEESTLSDLEVSSSDGSLTTGITSKAQDDISASTTIHIQNAIEEEALSVKNQTDTKIEELRALLTVTTPDTALHDALTHLIGTLTELSDKFSNLASTGTTTNPLSSQTTAGNRRRARRRASSKEVEFENLKVQQSRAMMEAEYLSRQAQANKNSWLSLFW